jgi:hypothetical protein
MDPIMEGLMPITIVAIIFTTLSAVAIVLIFAAIKKRKMEIDAYKVAIDKGLPVPELKIRATVKSPTSTLKAALVWIAIGIGFGIMMLIDALQDSHDFMGVGVASVPILIGIALIISYFIEKKERDKESNNSKI